MTTSNEEPARRIHTGGQAGLLAAVPRLIGFEPERSLVVLGLAGERGRVHVTMRYDLPLHGENPGAIAYHATLQLVNNDLPSMAAVGYGTGSQVTPTMDAVRSRVTAAGVVIRDALRVEDGRYWSYQCDCPPEGTPLGEGLRISAADLDLLGRVAPGGREALAAELAPVAGEQAAQMRAAYDRAIAEHRETRYRGGRAATRDAGLVAVRGAIAAAEHCAPPRSPDEHARIGVALKDVEVRDDAWARISRPFGAEHAALWADSVRRAPDGFAAAPASLLGFAEAVRGNGARANVAAERALQDDPSYSMAHLLRQALEAGLPPDKLAMAMTPDEVARSYGRDNDIEAGQ